MPENKQLVIYAAAYESVEAALADLDAVEQLHKDKVIGQYDAAVIDQENGKPHIVKRMDRPYIRIIPEWFGGGTLPRSDDTAQASRALGRGSFRCKCSAEPARRVKPQRMASLGSGRLAA